MWNVKSMVNKSDAIMEHLLDRDPSVVFISEIWLKSDKNLVTSLVKTYGYILFHNRKKNREKDIGDGVGVLIKNGLEYKHASINHILPSNFVLLNCILVTGSPYR